MRPADALAALRRSILAGGEWVTLVREGTPDVQAEIMAIWRAGGWTDVVTGVAQGDGLLILSPAHLTAAGFAGVPRKGDRMLIQARKRTVEDVRARALGNVLVRLELRVKG